MFTGAKRISENRWKIKIKLYTHFSLNFCRRFTSQSTHTSHITAYDIPTGAQQDSNYLEKTKSTLGWGKAISRNQVCRHCYFILLKLCTMHIKLNVINFFFSVITFAELSFWPKGGGVKWTNLNDFQCCS